MASGFGLKGWIRVAHPDYSENDIDSQELNAKNNQSAV